MKLSKKTVAVGEVLDHSCLPCSACAGSALIPYLFLQQRLRLCEGQLCCCQAGGVPWLPVQHVLLIHSLAITVASLQLSSCSSNMT